MKKKAIILGATSRIAQETAILFARENASLFLVARNEDHLKTVAADLRIRGAAQVGYYIADLTNFSLHDEIIRVALKELGSIDVVLISYGVLGNQKNCEGDLTALEEVIKVNFLSVVSLLTKLMPVLEKQGKGTVAVLSSVAGDRGRRSNYIYGSSKGALNIFLSGLRSRVHPLGINIITIKLGLVDSPMTSHMLKNILFSQPEQVARGIHKSIHKKKDVVYLPAFWFFIIAMIKLIPEMLFKRMSF